MNRAVDATIALVFSTLVCATVYAECTRELSSFSNNVDADPSHSVMADGARTTEDFQVSTANFFFFSDAGQTYVENAISDPSYVSVVSSLWNGTFSPATGFHSVPVCSDVGQCVQGGISGIFGRQDLPDGSVSVEVTDGVSIDVPIDGGTESQLTGFLVVAWDASGDSASAEYNLSSIAARQTAGAPFDLPSKGTPDEAQQGDGCRDNEGNEVDENDDQTGAGGGGDEGLVIDSWTTPNPWQYNDNTLVGARCFECWGTPDGVACREVALSRCF